MVVPVSKAEFGGGEGVPGFLVLQTGVRAWQGPADFFLGVAFLKDDVVAFQCHPFLPVAVPGCSVAAVETTMKNTIRMANAVPTQTSVFVSE